MYYFYFQVVFVDHNSKTTTFIDPRLPLPGKQLQKAEDQGVVRNSHHTPYHCTIIPLYHYTIYHCSDCTIIPLYHYFIVSLYHYSYTCTIYHCNIVPFTIVSVDEKSASPVCPASSYWYRVFSSLPVSS